MREAAVVMAALNSAQAGEANGSLLLNSHRVLRSNRVAVDGVRQARWQHKRKEKKTKTNKIKQRGRLSQRRQLDVRHFSLKVLACHPPLSLESLAELAVNSQCNCPRATKSDVPLFLARGNLTSASADKLCCLCSIISKHSWLWTVNMKYSERV